jgi:hypothetical protein
MDPLPAFRYQPSCGNGGAAFGGMVRSLDDADLCRRGYNEWVVRRPSSSGSHNLPGGGTLPRPTGQAKSRPVAKIAAR